MSDGGGTEPIGNWKEESELRGERDGEDGST